MKIVKVKGPSGSVRISSSPELDIAEALELDHDCDSRTCDIDAAASASYYLVAAGFLLGATECPLLERTIAAHRFNGTLREDPSSVYKLSEWSAWQAYFRAHSTSCDACGAWTTDPDAPPRADHCDNCLAPIRWSTFPRGPLGPVARELASTLAALATEAQKRFAFASRVLGYSYARDGIGAAESDPESISAVESAEGFARSIELVAERCADARKEGR